MTQHTHAGVFPYKRGIHSTMYASKPWTIRQYAGFADASESNAFYRQALAQGQKGLSLAFDLPTHRGYDSDAPQALGDVGTAGVAIDTWHDMARLFEGIPLRDMSVSMTMNGAVLPIMAFFILAAQAQGTPPAALRGTVQNDILKEFMVRNTYIYPPEASMRITTDVIAYCSTHMPLFNPISISGYHLHEAGANTVQELAYTIANGICYVQQVQQRYGLDIDDFAPRLSFFFAIGADFFTEIAKLRAARVLWAEAMQALGAKKPASCMLRTHCQTSGVSLTAQDPYNNVMRTTLQALAAVLGGTQSLHTNGFDEALALPSPLAARLARNTQLILQHETGICAEPDPLGGSVYLETLTENLCAQARSLLQHIDTEGGMVQAIANGVPQQNIALSAQQKQAHFDNGTHRLVGVHMYAPDDDTPPPLRVIDDTAVRAAQTALLQQHKAQRNAAQCDNALQLLAQAAATPNAPLLPPTIDAARAGATLGEISATLEQVFGRYQAPIHVAQGVYAHALAADEDFNRVRVKTNVFLQKHQQPPSICLLKLGQDGHDRGLKSVAAALHDMGFVVHIGDLFATPAQAVAFVAQHRPHLCGVNTLAGGHKVQVPQFMQLLRAQGHTMPVVCGGIIPPHDIEALQQSGVCQVFGSGSNLCTAAEALLGLLDGQL